MKSSLNSAFLYFVAFLFTGSTMFQSCTPSNDIQPIASIPHTITIKLENKNQESFTEGQPPKHLRITTADETQKVLLDTNINGSFTYNFKTLQPEVNITATLTSTSLFLYDMEIDVNGIMHSEHGGSCPVTAYSITDYINL